MSIKATSSTSMLQGVVVAHLYIWIVQSKQYSTGMGVAMELEGNGVEVMIGAPLLQLLLNL